MEMTELKQAWASPTADLLVETVRVAYEVGGTRVVEVLRELADQIRRDRNTRREILFYEASTRTRVSFEVAAYQLFGRILLAWFGVAACHLRPAQDRLDAGNQQAL